MKTDALMAHLMVNMWYMTYMNRRVDGLLDGEYVVYAIYEPTRWWLTWWWICGICHIWTDALMAHLMVNMWYMPYMNRRVNGSLDGEYVVYAICENAKHPTEWKCLKTASNYDHPHLYNNYYYYRYLTHKPYSSDQQLVSFKNFLKDHNNFISFLLKNYR